VSSRRSRKTPLLNYNHLHYFHVAAVEGSVGGAAQYLGVTQPTISEQLRTLEKALGVVLFERQPSGLKLTEAGRLTFKHTSVMFGAGARLAEELDHGSQQVPHVLRVGVCGPVARMSASSLLTPLLGIERCVPSIRIAEHVELLRDLRSGALDLALTDTEPPKSERRGIECLLLQRTQLSVVARPDLQPSATWRELELLHYRVGSQLRWDVDAFLTSRGVQPRIAAEADDAWLLLDAVGVGNHIAVIPYALVREALATGKLRELERFQSAHVGLYAVHRTGVDLARSAVDRLASHFGVSAIAPTE
jgi:LysR family transcriptional regulator, transcriptional activator of nhaA